MMLNSKAEDYHHHHYYKVSLLNQLIQMNYVIRCLEIFVINQQEQQHYHVLLTISRHVLIASLYQTIRYITVINSNQIFIFQNIILAILFSPLEVYIYIHKNYLFIYIIIIIIKYTNEKNKYNVQHLSSYIFHVYIISIICGW